MFLLKITKSDPPLMFFKIIKKVLFQKKGEVGSAPDPTLMFFLFFSFSIGSLGV